MTRDFVLVCVVLDGTYPHPLLIFTGAYGSRHIYLANGNRSPPMLLQGGV